MEQGPKDTNRHGSERNVGEGGYCPSLSGVLKPYISSGKKNIAAPKLLQWSRDQKILIDMKVKEMM